ncbi:unnamed protein product, partial [Allacma fusca]
MYSVIAFTEENDATAIVSSNWLLNDNTSTRWPPFKTAQKLQACVKSRQIPGNNWEESPCRVLNSYDNYDFARKYALPQSVYTSELSDMDDVVPPRHAQSKFTRRMMNENGPENAKRSKKCNPITSIVLPTPPAPPVSTIISSAQMLLNEDVSERDPVGQLDTHCSVSFPESQSCSYDNMFSQRSCTGLVMYVEKSTQTEQPSLRIVNTDFQAYVVRKFSEIKAAVNQ